MRKWIVQITGMVIWTAIVFTPFMAQASQGFDIILPLDWFTQVKSEKNSPPLYSDFGLSYDGKPHRTYDDNKWSLRFNAGKDTVLNHDFKDNIEHDRLHLDDGHRESFRFSIGLNYTF